MKYEIRDIETENGTSYQIWKGDEPVSYIFNKVSAAVRLMRRLRNESKDQPSEVKK